MRDVPTQARPPTTARQPGAAPSAGLVDLLDRVVARGAVVTGDLVISLAGVDLIRLDLRLLLVSVDTMLSAAESDSPIRRSS